jgi:acyl-coenzyme A synthetase/AMP-(fatty) acid ligase
MEKNILINKFRQFTDRPSLIWSDKTYTYGWLLENMAEWEKIFKDQKIFDKKVVAIESEYSPKAVALLVALLKNKFIIVPISSINPEEIKNRIATAEVQVVIKINSTDTHDIEFTDKNFSHPFIKNLVDKSRAGLILFSSGSTGKPKAMVHDLDKLVNVYLDRKPRNLITLLSLLFDHIGGINTLFNILASGGAAVLPSRRDPEEVCELIEKYKAHILPTSPTFLNLIIISDAHKRFDLSSLKLITYGTEPMPQSVLKRLKEVFPKAKILQTFGTSETGIVTTKSKSSESLYMKLDDKNFEHKIVDGELWIKSKTQILGYLNQDNPFTKDGWFPTGDLVELTEDKYLKIIGRKNEMINVGGQKVLPSEVESILLEMSEIEDVLVFGKPNPLVGEIVAAKLVLKKILPKQEIIKKIKKYCMGKLETYKVPVYIDIEDSLDYGDRFKKRRPV